VNVSFSARKTNQWGKEELFSAGLYQRTDIPEYNAVRIVYSEGKNLTFCVKQEFEAKLNF
jgi:hypothetical protein